MSNSIARIYKAEAREDEYRLDRGWALRDRDYQWLNPELSMEELWNRRENIVMPQEIWQRLDFLYGDAHSDSNDYGQIFTRSHDFSRGISPIRIYLLSQDSELCQRYLKDFLTYWVEEVNDWMADIPRDRNNTSIPGDKRDHYAGSYFSLLDDLAAQEKLDREFLIHLLLGEILLEEPQQQARRAHILDFLQPTANELEPFAEELILGLASDATALVSSCAGAVSKLYRAKMLDAAVLLKNLPEVPLEAATHARKVLKILFEITDRVPELREDALAKTDRYRFHKNSKLAAEVTEFLARYGEVEIEIETIERIETDYPPEPLSADSVVPWTDETAPSRMAELVTSSYEPIAWDCAQSWLAQTDSNPLEILHSLKPHHKAINDDGQLLIQRVFEESLDTSDAPVLSLMTDTHGWLDLETLENRWKEIDQNKVNKTDVSRALCRLRPEDLATWRERHPEVGASLTLETQWDRALGTNRFRDSNIYGPDSGIETVAEIWQLPHATQTADEPAFTLSLGEWSKYEFHPGLLQEAALATPGYLYPFELLSHRVMLYSLTHSLGDESEIMKVLLWHEGEWSARTVELIALGLAAQKPETRLVAGEVLAMGVPARFPLQETVKVFAETASKVILTRWASSLSDVAVMTPYMVRDLLVEMLPQLDSKQRGIGDLLELLLDLVKRTYGFELTDDFAAYLGTFKGKSKAGTAASNLLATR